MNKTKIYLATDHAGFEYKELVKEFIVNKYGEEFELIDCGSFEMNETDDYTNFIHSAAKKLSSSLLNNNVRDDRAIVFGGSGEGEAIVMNRYNGIRCTTYYGGNLEIVRLGREHNNANAISFGARFVDFMEVKRAVEIFLSTEFDLNKEENKRHLRRIRAIDVLKEN